MMMVIVVYSNKVAGGDLGRGGGGGNDVGVDRDDDGWVNEGGDDNEVAADKNYSEVDGKEVAGEKEDHERFYLVLYWNIVILPWIHGHKTYFAEADFGSQF